MSGEIKKVRIESIPRLGKEKIKEIVEGILTGRYIILKPENLWRAVPLMFMEFSENALNELGLVIGIDHGGRIVCGGRDGECLPIFFKVILVHKEDAKIILDKLKKALEIIEE